MDEFKERQRAIWAAGDYPSIADLIWDVGEHVVGRTGVDAGMHVLDVACGTGNAALPAAQRGANVKALDLTPELLEVGRAKAEELGVDVEWLEGDAEALPFEDGTFHRVISTFGHMFAPRHRQTAEEMTRVCGEDGSIAMACWTPEGVAGEMFAATAKYMPPPPAYASPPALWGTENHVQEMFGAVARDFEFERRAVTMEWDAVEGFADYFTSRFGPLVTAKRVLGDGFEDLRRDLLEIWGARNEAEDGTLRYDQEYLVSVVKL